MKLNPYYFLVIVELQIMSFNFQKRRKDDDFVPAKSRKSGYYVSSAHGYGARKDLQELKGLYSIIDHLWSNPLSWKALFDIQFSNTSSCRIVMYYHSKSSLRYP